MAKITQAKWWLGEDPKWSWEYIFWSVLYLGGMALVYGTGMPNDLGMWLICLWAAYSVTTLVWCRRYRKLQRKMQQEVREAQDRF